MNILLKQQKSLMNQAHPPFFFLLGGAFADVKREITALTLTNRYVKKQFWEICEPRIRFLRKRKWARFASLAALLPHSNSFS